MIIEDFLEFAWEQFDKYGLTQEGWVVEINPNISTLLGLCCYHDKVIVISEKHIKQSSIADIKDTVGHECIHAILGPGYGHGPIWQKKCIENGIIPLATSSCRILNKKYIELGHSSSR